MCNYIYNCFYYLKYRYSMFFYKRKLYDEEKITKEYGNDIENEYDFI